jgi:hypothetical protein
MMSFSSRPRAAGLTLAILLAAGCAYSGVATFRLVHQLFRQPAADGPSATVDAFLAPVNLSSAAPLRRAVRCLWPSREEIAVVGDGSLTTQEMTQIYYVAGYLLQPHRILLRPHGSALPARLIVAGRPPQPSDARSRTLSDMLTLVERR